MSAFPAMLMTSGGTSNPQIIQLEQNVHWQAAPEYALGFIVTVSPGASLVYTVQVTADQVPSNNSQNWNNHDILVGQTTSQNSNVAYAITGYRLVVTSYVSGTVNLGVAKWP